MKVLFYNHTGQVSGAERVMLMILSGLDCSQVSPVVMCPAKGRLMTMASELGVRTIEIEQLSARFTWRLDRLFQYVLSLARVVCLARATIKKEAPDIIHANSIRAGLVMSAATFGLGLPVVWHAHDLLPRHPISTAIRLFACVSRRNRIIAVSHAVAGRFQGWLIQRFRERVPVQTIHNAVDLKRFHPDPESRREIRRSLGVREAETVVGIVGQLTPRKGQLELIEAFAEVWRDVPDAKLLIVGEALFNCDEEYAKSLLRAAMLSGAMRRIRFLGPREDVPAIMRGLDLLAINSRTEPFGLIAIEAMASGTPVLATAVDGIAEIIRHNESGWLISPPNHRSLVEGMLTLLRDAKLRERLGRCGRREVKVRFSTDRFLNEIQSLYGSTLLRVPASPLRARNFKTELSPD